MRSVKVFLAVLPVFLLLDFVWLGVLMKDFYKSELGSLARRSGDSLTPNMWAAFLVYALIVAGLVAFVLPKFASGASVWLALAWGAAYGGVVYGVYELTNYSLLADWSWRITLADILWGCTICGLTAVAMHFAARWVGE